MFTLHVSTDGTWTFDLDDQLDHVAGSGENFDLRTNAAGTTSVSSIDFSSLLTVTDADGDNLSLLQTGDFTVAVKDDIPVRVSNPTPIHAGVSEGGLSTAVDEAPTGAAGNDLSDGNLGAGETTTSTRRRARWRVRLLVWCWLGRTSRRRLALDEHGRASDAVLEGSGGQLCAE